MRITALAPWFGAKRNLAPRIVEVLGKHRVYWEPFCGSMAVLLVKPPCVMETVNDLHGDLTNLARVVQHQQEGPRLYRRLRRTLMVEDLCRESMDVVREDMSGNEMDAERAYHYMLASWLGRNGTAGTASYNFNFCVRYTASGGHAAKRWRSVVDSIPAWHKRLRNVTILRRDAFELLQRVEDKPGTAIYVDPPYLVKGAKYLHDLRPEQHDRLAELLNGFRWARVVLSYYDHPKLSELYPGWKREEIEVSKALLHQGQRGKNNSKALEVLLVNGALERRVERRLSGETD
jgi:DNA adenine methylase